VQGDQVSLSGEVLHHIRDVCRLHVGSKFEVIVKGGHAHLVEIVSESKKETRAQILETRAIPGLPEPLITLAMSIPRFPVFEAVLEKAVELGVASIQPFYSEYSFIRTQTDVWEKKRVRFEKIIQSATQQCGRGELMELAEPMTLQQLAAAFNRTAQEKGPCAGLFAYEGESKLSAREGLAAIHQLQPRQVWIFVGSEGGFSDSEVEYFRTLNLQTVTLGQQVLRVETACVALVSIIKYDLDLMR
jgi:16S rRNA (uracil1498-N3)-methyltransferase